MFRIGWILSPSLDYCRRILRGVNWRAPPSDPSRKRRRRFLFPRYRPCHIRL